MTLGNCVERARAYPESFRIPPEEDRLALEEGDWAKLVFEEGERGERMWVKVTRVEGPGRYEGVLDNMPVMLVDVQAGDEVEFGAEHVASILKGQP